MKIKSKGLFCKFLKVFDQGLNCNFQKLQGLFCQFWNLGIVTSPPSRVRWPNGNLPPATAGFAGNGAANLRSTPKPPDNFFTLLGTSPCPHIQQITQGLAGKSLKIQAAVEFPSKLRRGSSQPPTHDLNTWNNSLWPQEHACIFQFHQESPEQNPPNSD